jgi:hypothetical protein
VCHRAAAACPAPCSNSMAQRTNKSTKVCFKCLNFLGARCAPSLLFDRLLRDTKGGLQTFAASAQALGQSGESGRSMRGQIHKCCKRSNGDKPTLTDAALSTNGCFGDAAGAILHDCKSHVSLSDHERVNLKA